MRTKTSGATLAVVLALAFGACGNDSGGASAGVSGDTIKIGLVTSLTGDGAATLGQTQAGAQARVDVQNAAGGVNGHKLELVTADDQSSVQGMSTAVRQLVQRDGVFGVVGFSSFMTGGYKYLQKQGVPVTGAGFDGPEWGQQPNTNMFSIAPIDPDYPPAADWGKFFTSVGITNLGVIAYADIPSSQSSAKQLQKSAESVGVKAGYTNLSVPYGTKDFTAEVLAMKKQGVNGFLCSCDLSSELALSTAVKQAGLKAKGVLSTGYAQTVLDDPSSKAAAEGQYAYSYYVPFELKQKGTEAMLANLRKYDPKFKGGIPDYGLAGGYLSTELMIEGLKRAGRDPSRKSFITGLRGVTDYDAGGVLPYPISFGLDRFGKSADPICDYFVQLKGDAYVPQPKVCGALLPTS